MKSLAMVLLASVLMACGQQTKSTEPSATPNPNAARPLSVSLCETLQAKPQGFYIVDYRASQALIIDHGNVLFLIPGGMLFPPDDGDLDLTYCHAQIHAGKIISIQ